MTQDLKDHRTFPRQERGIAAIGMIRKARQGQHGMEFMLSVGLMVKRHPVAARGCWSQNIMRFMFIRRV